MKRHLIAALLLAPLASCAWWQAPLDNPSAPPPSDAPADPANPDAPTTPAPEGPTNGDGIIGIFQGLIATVTGNPVLAVGLGAAAKIAIDAAIKSKKPKVA